MPRSSSQNLVALRMSDDIELGTGLDTSLCPLSNGAAALSSTIDPSAILFAGVKGSSTVLEAVGSSPVSHDSQICPLTRSFAVVAKREK